MDITHIRYFLEVAQTQHMTESAEKLHIAQPALSRSIKNFEKEIGVNLFEAKGRNIVLTEYGKYLREQLIPIMEKLDKLPYVLQTMAKLNGETIHLNVLAASTIATSAIINYKSSNEGVNFQLLQNSENNVFDIEITTRIPHRSSAVPGNNQFVCNEKIYLAVPNSERFRNRKKITLKEVENEGFISLIGSKQFRYICDRFCRSAQVNPKIIFESDNIAAVKNMIAANIGVGFWPEFTWGRNDNEHIKLLEIASPSCSRDIIITYNQNKTDNKKTAEFFEFLKEYFIQMKKYSAEQ